MGKTARARSLEIDLIYVVKGIPIPLCRPRYSQGRRPWDSQREEKVKWGLQVEAQHGDRPLYEGPIHLDINFYFSPGNALLKRISQEEGRVFHHYYRPDLSNLIKFVEDAITGIVYRDDCIIASIDAHKLYSTDPRTEFTISAL